MDSQGAATASPSIFPGATISGRFRIERLLGRGAMGSVWLARHLALDVDVAVKFIDGAFRNEKGHRGRFELEAQSAARINSPHVVSVLDFGEDDGRLYIAMEFLSGEDLGTVLDRSKSLSLDVTARIVAHACRGLGKAHALGIAHRDIKPENLFLCGDAEDEGFVLKILDFGVAKSEQTSASFTRTTAGALIGSPAFMSPEQARGLPGIDGRSDLFSLAVVAYHCLTGVTPFSGESLTELLFEVLGADPDPVSKLVPGLPRALDAWFERALQKEPSRRFASAKEMAQAFQMAIGQHSSSAADYINSSPTASNSQANTIVSDDPIVEITSHPPRPAAASAASASNTTASSGVATALAQLGEIGNVLGVGLVGPSKSTLAHHSTTGLTAASFGEIVERALDALEAFENLEPAHPQALALHFEGASVLLRWIEGHVLVVVGTERVNPTVLTVNLNAAASRLQAMAAQGGGAAVVFRATLSEKTETPAHQTLGGGARANATDPIPDAILSQLTQLYARPLGAVGRLSILQRLKINKPTYGSFADFVRSLAPTIDDANARNTFVSAALELLPQASRVQPAAAPTDAPPLVARPSSPSAAASSPPATLPGQKPVPAPAPKHKRTIVYRGRKVEVDE